MNLPTRRATSTALRPFGNCIHTPSTCTLSSGASAGGLSWLYGFFMGRAHRPGAGSRGPGAIPFIDQEPGWDAGAGGGAGWGIGAGGGGWGLLSLLLEQAERARP